MSSLKITNPHQIKIPGDSKGHCHELVAETAKGMAHELWEGLMSQNKAFSEYKAIYPDATTKELEEIFVNNLWPKLTESARSTLASMLNQHISDDLKDQISSALILDNPLRLGRARARNKPLPWVSAT